MSRKINMENNKTLCLTNHVKCAMLPYMDLSKYTKEYDISDKVLAEYIGVTVTFIQMVKANKRRLGAAKALKCVEFTGGKVTLEELMRQKPSYR